MAQAEVAQVTDGAIPGIGIRNNRLNQVQRTGPDSRPAAASRAENSRAGGHSFKDAVHNKLQSAAARGSSALVWSRHAHDRLQASGFSLGAEQESALSNAVDKVAARGGRDSLVLMGDLALVINVPNRTVITAASADRLQDGVFTQIDSAVILDRAIAGGGDGSQLEIQGAGPQSRKLSISPNDSGGIQPRRSMPR